MRSNAIEAKLFGLDMVDLAAQRIYPAPSDSIHHNVVCNLQHCLALPSVELAVTFPQMLRVHRAD